MFNIYANSVNYSIRNNCTVFIVNRYILNIVMMVRNGLCVINVKDGFIHNVLIYLLMELLIILTVLGVAKLISRSEK